LFKNTKIRPGKLYLPEILEIAIPMKRNIALFLMVFVLSAGLANAQKMTRSEYIQKYQLLAISEMNRSGIPASIKMAQACLESADGNSELARKSNNHFGIKCKSNWTGATTLHDDDEKNECFRKYHSVEDSFVDHTNFLVSSPRYAALFQLAPTDYAGWARGLSKAGYATNPNYPKLLIDIIELNQLWLLDHKMTASEMAQFEQKRLGNSFNQKMLVNPYSTRKLSIHNGLKSAIARQGDTFTILGQEFGKKSWELMRYNDYPNGYEPRANEIIYLQKKRSQARGMYQYHVVDSGESMHYVAQLYGIKLSSLYRMNNMSPEESIRIGQVLQLKKKIK
jgi:hypothetical protein